MIRYLPEQYQGYLRLGRVYESAALEEKAMRNYQKSIHRNPANVTALFYLGRLYQRRHRWKQAIETFQVLLSYQPNEWATRVRLGSIFLKRNAPDDRKLATYQFLYVEREATRYTHPMRLYFIGKELYQHGRTKEAIAWLQRACRKKKPFPRAAYTLGLALRKERQHEKALQFLSQISPQRTALFIEAQAQIVELLVEQNRIQQARKLLAKTREKFQKRPDVWIKMSQAFIERAPVAEVENELRLLRPLRRQWAKHDGLLYHQAYLRFKQKKRDLCQKLLQQLLKRNAQHAPSLNFLGYLYAEEGVRLQEAKKLVDRALQLEPNNAYYMDSLGWVYFRLGKIDKARQVLEEVHRRLPQEVTVLIHLARTYQQNKQWQKALRLFLFVLKLNPEPHQRKEATSQIERLRRKLPPKTTSAARRWVRTK